MLHVRSIVSELDVSVKVDGIPRWDFPCKVKLAWIDKKMSPRECQTKEGGQLGRRRKCTV